ncbi:MAG: ribonuclease P protein component [Alistipes sp.]|nr:ribonuclease P protein component [Alistipes sp.]
MIRPAHDYTFPRAEHLKSKKKIAALFAQGEGGMAYPLRYKLLRSDPATSGIEVLISVSKRYHKHAVARNLLKRRIREAYRHQRAALQAALPAQGGGYALALLYISAQIADYAKIEDAVAKIIQQLGKKSE